jgi:peptide-methionine (S)-S-oxide reductase
VNATYRHHGATPRRSRSSSTPRDLLPRDPGVLLPDPRPDHADRQGNDVGSSYRSAIFYVNDEQRQVAEDTIADVDASGLWPGKVVTEVSPAGPFWEAEPEHQDYLEHYPNGYTCHFPRPELGAAASQRQNVARGSTYGVSCNVRRTASLRNLEGWAQEWSSRTR